MTPEAMLANISRCFFEKHRVYRYQLKKIEDMSDEECIRNCHWFCEENQLTDEFTLFRKKMESSYRYCAYLSEYIEEGLCHDVQMIANGYIKGSALPDHPIDADKAISCCENCAYKF